MDTIKNILATLTGEQLKELESLIKVEQNFRKKDIEFKRVKSELQDKGYSLSTQYFESILIKRLYFNVDVSAHDKEYKSDISYEGLSDKQNEWTEYFNLEDIVPKEIDTRDIIIYNDDWDYGDWDGPASGVGKVSIFLYYILKGYPKDGQFDAMYISKGDIDPKVLTYEIIDREVHIVEGEVFDDALNPHKLNDMVIMRIYFR